MDDARLRRAGLDYREYAEVAEHSGFEAYLESARPARLFALSANGARRYTEVRYQEGDAFLFGGESAGLPDRLLVHASVAEVLRIPLLAGRRSLNLSNSAAVVLYEAWRQLGFGGGV